MVELFASCIRHFCSQVQARTWQCGRVSCTCGIVAREGNDIVRIDMCHGSYGHTFPKVTIPNKSTFSQGTVIQKDPHGTKFVVSFNALNYLIHSDKGHRIFFGTIVYIITGTSPYKSSTRFYVRYSKNDESFVLNRGISEKLWTFSNISVKSYFVSIY